MANPEKNPGVEQREDAQPVEDETDGSSLDEPTAEERAERREEAGIEHDERTGGTIPSDNPPEED